MAEKKLKICSEGHKFYKSSDCPVCPICENEKKGSGFLSLLSAPARRALQGRGISSLDTLAEFHESEIASLHGMGPSALKTLKGLLDAEGLSFRKKSE